MIEYARLTHPVGELDQKGFIAAYKEAFGGKPYFETYEDQEVLEDVLLPHLRDGVVVVARDHEQVIGFGCALPLSKSPADVLGFMTGQFERGGVDGFEPDRAWYMSELGVLEVFRGRKIGYQLTKRRLEIVAQMGGNHYVMRTAAEGSNSRHLYERIGSVPLDEEQNITASSQVKVNQSQSTSRVYLYGQCQTASALIAQLC